MKRSTTAIFAMVIAAVAAAPLAQAQHSDDIIIGVEHAKLTTGIIDTFGQPVFPHYVWWENFGSAGFPNYAADPGFDSLSGTFEPGTVVGISVRRALRLWNDEEKEPNFDEVPEETLEISRFGSSMTTPELDVSCDPPSLLLGVANLSGIIHAHPDYFLNAPAEPGIYLLELELWTDAQGIGPSDPFWIVFNQYQPAKVVAEAVQWVEDNLAGTYCRADINGDGLVDVSDLLLLLGAWGDDPPAGGPPADLNRDCAVDVSDLLLLLASWGACP